MKKKNTLPNIFPGEYRFVPAAYYASNAAGMGMYIRYRKSDLKVVRKRSQDARHIWLEMPDREVILVRMTHSEPFYPSEGNFDQFVNLNFYQEQSARDLGFDYYMTNYTDYIGKEQHSPKNRRVRDPKAMSVISDSGGFQFLTGKLDYLDPAVLVEWYNENADIGIVLDIPLASQVLDSGLHLKLANIQKRNTKVLLDGAVPGLEFMNVVHGVTLDAKLRFHERVHDPRIRRLALGGSYFDTVMSSIANVLMLHRAVGENYDHYHFLGVTNLFQVLTYMRMAHHKLLPFATSDSSTYYQKGASKEYLIQPRMTDNVSHLNIGQRDNVCTPFNVLPCSCPVCSNLRYTDALSNFGGSSISSATAFHNAWRYNEYLKAMGTIIDWPLPKLAKLLTQQLGKRASLKEGLKTLEFVDAVAEIGLDKAIKKFQYFLNLTGMNEGSKSAVVGLFDKKVEAVDVDKVVVRANFLISQYDAPRADNKTVQQKEKLGHKKIHSSKAKKREGKSQVKLKSASKAT
jgi:hypothetical protein